MSTTINLFIYLLVEDGYECIAAARNERRTVSDCSTDGNLFIYLQQDEFDFEHLQLGRVIARLEVKAVQRKGHGIFAREDIKKGAFICEYVGYVL